MTSEVVRITLIFTLQRHEHVVRCEFGIEPFDPTLQQARVELDRAGNVGRAQCSQERMERAVPIGSGREDAEPGAELRGDVCLERSDAADLAQRVRVELDRAGDVGRAQCSQEQMECAVQPGANGAGSAHQVWL